MTARHCPAGHGAFDDWVEKCPECRRTLVETAPSGASPSRRDDQPIVFLATVDNEPLADLWSQILRDADIPVMAKPLGPGFGAWGSAAVLEHALYVLESDLERAREVIDGVEGLGFDEEYVDEEGDQEPVR